MIKVIISKSLFNKTINDKRDKKEKRNENKKLKLSVYSKIK